MQQCGHLRLQSRRKYRSPLLLFLRKQTSLLPRTQYKADEKVCQQKDRWVLRRHDDKLWGQGQRLIMTREWVYEDFVLKEMCFTDKKKTNNDLCLDVNKYVYVND